jgi:hypothetical protein
MLSFRSSVLWTLFGTLEAALARVRASVRVCATFTTHRHSASIRHSQEPAHIFSQSGDPRRPNFIFATDPAIHPARTCSLRVTPGASFRLTTA